MTLRGGFNMADQFPANDPTHHLTGIEYTLSPTHDGQRADQVKAPQHLSNGYRLGKNGAILPLVSNVVEMIKSNPKTSQTFRYNEFSDEVFVFGSLPDEKYGQDSLRPLSDGIVRIFTTWIQIHGIDANSKLVHEAILTVAEKHRYHPVRDYLSSLIWDGVGRIDTMFARHGGADDTLYLRHISRRWMIQAVARIFQPGCKADAMLVLEGDQGLKKSTYLSILAGAWFMNTMPPVGTKDAAIAIRGVWIVEVAELSAMIGVRADKAKAFLSAQHDRYRSPFDRSAATHPRSCVFAGTFNPSAIGYLRDPTGGRRYWPVTIKRRLNSEELKTERDMLWAEAVQLYKDGHNWYLDDGELEQLAKEEQAARYEEHPWHERVSAYTHDKDRVSSAEILEKCLGLDITKHDQRQMNVVASILKTLDFERRQVREAGRQVWRYFRRNK